MGMRHYPTDITDTEWQLFLYCFPKVGKTGRPREHTCQYLLNAMFYVVCKGCQWRNLPRDFAPWSTADGCPRYAMPKRKLCSRIIAATFTIASGTPRHLSFHHLRRPPCGKGAAGQTGDYRPEPRVHGRQTVPDDSVNLGKSARLRFETLAY
jgi:transposase